MRKSDPIIKGKTDVRVAVSWLAGRGAHEQCLSSKTMRRQKNLNTEKQVHLNVLYGRFGWFNI